MKPATIRFIDIWGGKSACFALTVGRKFLDALPRRRPPVPPVNKILFIKLIEQGATVLASAAVRRAQTLVGRENVFFLVFEENREILEIMELVPPENIFGIRNEGFITLLGDLVRRLITIRRLGIDAAVDMEFFARASAVISFLTGACRRAGLHRFTSEIPYRGDLMTHRLQHNPYLHTATAYSLLVEALTLSPDELPLPKKKVDSLPESPPAFAAGPEEMKTFRRALAQEGLDVEKGRPIIILNPNASDMLPLRKWPLNYFSALGTAILRDYPEAYLVVTGGPAEREAAGKLCQGWTAAGVINLAGKTTLRELLMLYTLADVLVTNDSGPAHFSSLTGIQSIVLYGPETPRLFGPLSQKSHALYARLACSPCVNAFNHRFSPCRNNLCLQSIRPEEVYAKVKECLAAGKGG